MFFRSDFNYSTNMLKSQLLTILAHLYAELILMTIFTLLMKSTISLPSDQFYDSKRILNFAGLFTLQFNIRYCFEPIQTI